MLATIAALAASLALAAESKAPTASVVPWANEVAGMFQAGNLDGISSRFAPNLASLLSPEAFRDGSTESPPASPPISRPCSRRRPFGTAGPVSSSGWESSSPSARPRFA